MSSTQSSSRATGAGVVLHLLLSVLSTSELAVCQETAAVTRTAFEFSRAYDTCDSDDDRPLDGTTRVIYAWNPVDPPTPDRPQQHGGVERGSASVNLLGANPRFDVPETDVERFDMTVTEHTVAAGAYSTLYWCEIFKVPDDKPYHVVQFDMVVNPENIVNVHHAVAYDCPQAEALYAAGNTTGTCSLSGGSVFADIRSCESGNPVWAWGVGGENNTLPTNVGYPVGRNSTTYILLQMHYDFPVERELTDNSGIVFHMTPTLRPIEAGTGTFGSLTYSSTIRIPPNRSDFQIEAWCPGSCFEEDIRNTSEGKINVLATFLHTHLTGTGIRASHYRDGVELPPILEDASYDFNYQQYRWHTAPIEVLPGDDLGLTCTYDTTGRDEDTVGGIGTNEEMCLAYFMYYPRLTASKCWGSVLNTDTDTLPEGTPLLSCNSEPLAPFQLPTVTTEYVEPDNCADKDPLTLTEPTPIEAADLETWHESFDFSATLRGGGDFGGGDYELYWSLNAENETVRFGVDVATGGWVGFGFSPNGNMLGADMIMAWVADDGEIFFSDRHSDAFALPALDESQDYVGVRGVQYTVDADGGLTVLSPVTPDTPDDEDDEATAGGSVALAPTLVSSVVAASLSFALLTMNHVS